MCASRPPQAGFSLLEAIVAMVVMATALLALYSWLSASTLGVTRAQAQARALEDSRTALALMETINPLAEPSGRRQLGDIEVAWESTEVAPRRTGTTRSGRPSLFDVALYEVQVTVHRAGEPPHGFAVRRAGWEAVRTMVGEDF